MKYNHICLLNHPKNEEGVFKALVEKYDKFDSLYIGVDFDNTLHPYNMTDENEFPNGFRSIVALLREAKQLGLKLCLWTLPTSKENLDWKVEWCKNHGIEMDFVNDSPLLSEYSSQFRKPHFNLLLDDVAGLESSYSILMNLVEYIKNKKKIT